MNKFGNEAIGMGNCYLAEDAVVAGMTAAREGIDAIDAVSMVTRRALTVVNIHLIITKCN